MSEIETLLRKDELAELSAQKLRLLAAGHLVNDLSMFNPDLAPPRFLLDKLMEASAKPFNHRYAVSRGVRKLREAFAEKYSLRFQVTVDAEREVCATLGTKDAIRTLLEVVAPAERRGRVLCVSPVYPAYRSAVLLAGMELLTVATPNVEDAKFESALLRTLEESAQSEKPDVILLNFPNNPSGRVVTSQFWERMVQISGQAGALLANDFVYGELVYGGQAAPSALAAVKGPGVRVVESYSLSKAYSVPGWRVGALLGDAATIERAVKLKTHADYGIFLPVQLAAAAALQSKGDLSRQACEEYAKRADLLATILSRLGFGCARAQAGGSLWARAPRDLLERCGGGHTLSSFLLESCGVLAAPGWLYGEEWAEFLRFALVVPVEQLRDVGARIEKVLSGLIAEHSNSENTLGARS